MTRACIGELRDFPVGECRLVDVQGLSVGIFNRDGQLYALRNECPHAGAPICLGQVGGTMLPSPPGELSFGLEGWILRCPWHGLEVDIRTGRPLIEGRRLRVRRYDLVVENQNVFVEI